MVVESNKFFQESILAITSSLNIELALYRCYQVFKRYLPVDHLMLMHPQFEKGRMKVLAQANDDGGAIDGRHWELPDDVISLMTSNQVPQVMIVNHPETHFIAKHALWLGAQDASIIIVRLLVGEKLIGSLILRKQGHGQYNQEHAGLLGPLREPFAVALSNSLQFQELTELKNRLAEESRFFQDELNREAGQEIIGADYGLRRVMEMVHRVAHSDSPVLLMGGTGVGKEIIARAIHQLSGRKNAPLIKLNCGAIAPSLLDSELFGYEKGAFTGATDRYKGRFERADGGTLFLDEVGELTNEAQIRLLRVLQEQEIDRLGGQGPVKINVRVIAATHRNLEEMVSQSRFRQDLFYRLAVFPIDIPPLAERRGDLPLLVRHFIHKKARRMGFANAPEVDLGAMRRLTAYDWPGNVRELENAVERELLLTNGGELHFDWLGQNKNDALIRTSGAEEEVFPSLGDAIAKHIRSALSITKHKIAGPGGAAELLDINPSTLRSKMRKLGMRTKSMG